MNHYEIWRAIELFASDHGLSCSGLARQSGLDPTIFNKSKRMSSYGQPRWPTMGSIAKILDSTGVSIMDFCKYIQAAKQEYAAIQKCGDAKSVD